MEVEKLKEQLRNMLMERKREAKRAFDMAGQMSKGSSARPHHNAPRKNQEETIKVVSDCQNEHSAGLPQAAMRSH